MHWSEELGKVIHWGCTQYPQQPHSFHGPTLYKCREKLKTSKVSTGELGRWMETSIDYSGTGSLTSLH